MITNEKLIGLSFVKLGLGLFKKKIKDICCTIIPPWKKTTEEIVKSPKLP